MIGFIRRRIGRKMALAGIAVGMGAAAVGIYLSSEPMDSRASLVLFGAVMAGVLATVLCMRIVVLSPLRRLSAVMKTAEKGDFLKRVEVETDDEIGQIATQFNLMLARITDLAAEQIDTEREREQMQRELSLQDQLAEKTNALETRIRDLVLLMDITRAISSTLELDEVLAKVAEMIGGSMGFNEFSVVLYDDVEDEYEIATAYGFPEEVDVVGLTFKSTEGIIGIMHERQETVLIQDTAAEPRYLHFKGQRKDDGSLLAIPLLYHDTIVGALSFNRPGKNAFELHELWLLEAVAAQAAMAIANARLHRQTVELSLTDALTGVANRRDLGRSLDMELPRAERFENPLSVIMIDIDHFKMFNDNHGHPLGDEVLKTVAEILVECVRTVDTVARYGGEEFTVVLPRISKDRAVKVADKLRRAVGSHKFPSAETQPKGRLTLSLGVATFPDDAANVPELLTKADIALYTAKTGGRDRALAYEPGMEDALNEIKEEAARPAAAG